ncbi:hypothetical protein Tco_1517248 [Tanacetum coccineum]
MSVRGVYVLQGLYGKLKSNNSDLAMHRSSRPCLKDQENEPLDLHDVSKNEFRVSSSSDIEDSPINDRYAEGMHAVPPLMTGIYIPSGPDIEINESQFTYGPNEETFTSMPELVVNEPKVVSQPKVWSDAPIIEEYESDSDDEHVSLPTKEQETPCFDFVNTVKHVKTPRQTVKVQNT